MKVHYGVAIPPGLTAPTRGELIVRIERIALQDELLAPFQQADSPLIPVDHCAVSLVFWGAGTSSGTATCVPATDAHADRGVQRCIFPVKTLVPQLIQYFQHMRSSPTHRGLQLRVSVPPQFSGKKRHTPVGLSIVDLSGLTESTPIQGWFHVAFHGDETQCIGRVKLSISLTMFPTEAIELGSESTAMTAGTHSKPEREKQHASRASSPPPVAAAAVLERSDGVQGDAAARSVHTDPTDETMSVGKPLADASGSPPLMITSKQQPSAAAIGSSFTAKNTPEPTRGEAATIIPPSTSTPLLQQLTTDDSSILRGWFERGIALRNRMSQAAGGGGGGPHNFGQQPQQSQSSPLSSIWMGGAPPVFASTRITQMSGAEHLHQGLNDSCSTSSGSDSDVSVSAASDDEEDGVNLVAKVSDHQPAAALRHQKGTHSSVNDVQSIAFDGALALSLSNFGFSGPLPMPQVPPSAHPTHHVPPPPPAAPLCELRFTLRWSRDVILADPMMLLTPTTQQHSSYIESGSSVVSSFVHVLPFPDEDKHREIRLALPRVLGYSTASKLVVECVRVLSVEAPPPERNPAVRDPKTGELHFNIYPQQHHQQVHPSRVVVAEAVVGVCVLDLCPCVARRCAFHDPITGNNLVWCDCRLELHGPDNADNAHVLAVDGGLTMTGPGDAVSFFPKDYARAARESASLVHKKANTLSAEHPLRPSRGDAGSSGDEEDPQGDTYSSATSENSCGEADTSSSTDGGGNVHRAVRRSSDRRASSPCGHREGHHPNGPRIVVYPDRSNSCAWGTNEVTVTVRETAAERPAGNGTPRLCVGSAASPSMVSRGASTTISSQNATRFHLSVLEAKELPRVCLGGGALDTADDASYAAPHTFVALDELFEVPRRRQQLPSPPLMGEAPPRAIQLPWYVEAAVQGCGGRSALPVGGPSTSPRYAFECIVAIPHDELRAPHEQQQQHHEKEICTLAPPLDHIAGSLEIGVYNHCVERSCSPIVSLRGNSSDDAEEVAERNFWRSSVPLGKVSVDLSPLRYMTHIDGWYRIVSTNHAVETSVGFLRIGVRSL